MDRRERLAWLVALVLNLVDVVQTHIALEEGATETNLLARFAHGWFGTPGLFALKGLACLYVYRQSRRVHPSGRWRAPAGMAASTLLIVIWNTFQLLKSRT